MIFARFLGPSILIARLATRVAKPNGLHHVSLGEVTDFIKDKSLRDLPGEFMIYVKRYY